MIYKKLITKIVTAKTEKTLEENKYTTKTVEELNELKVRIRGSELMNKNGVIDASKIRL